MARTIESIVICVGGCCRSMVTEQEKWLSPAATHKFMGQFVMRMRFANVLCHIRVCVSFDGSDNQVNKQTNEVFGTDRFFDGQITIIIWHLTKSIGLGLIDFSLHNNDEPNYDRRNARRFTFYVLCFQLALQWILHEFVLTLLWLTITQLARTIETGGLQCVWFRIQPTTRDQFNWFFLFIRFRCLCFMNRFGVCYLCTTGWRHLATSVETKHEAKGTEDNNSTTHRIVSRSRVFDRRKKSI